MMMLWENLKMAFASLSNAKMRSFLTMLGIIIGVAAVVAILAIGAGVKQSVQDQITGVINASAITVTSGKVNVKSGPAQSLGASTLTIADVSVITKLDHVTGVAPVSLISGNVSNGNTVANGSLIIATTPGYSRTQDLEFESGRFLTAADTNSAVVVLGATAKDALFGSADALGKIVTIRGTKFTVVGILKSAETEASSFSAGPNLENAVYMPFETATQITGSTPPITRIIAQVDTTTNVNAVSGAINSKIKASHNGQDDFTVLTQKDILSTVDSILGLLTTFIVAIASISLLVGGIGIMNIMLVSVTERTREIGLRKAIGASSSTVLSQFLIEAVVLSVIGGGIGIGAAIGLATVAGKISNITPIFTINSILLAVGVSAAVGIIFGIAPAIKAARKRPIQALKAQ